jgi:hypothetical protein
MKSLFLMIHLLIILPAVLFSQPEATVVRTIHKPAIDGVLSEEIWEMAVPVTGFVQREPDTGAPASQETEVLLLYDDNYLYIGIRCYDDPNKVIGREMARNASLQNDDRLQIILDTHLDGRNAYWFQIGPGGSIGDAVISANGREINRDWQGLWDGRASIQTHGWEAEIAIPFKTINFDSRKSTWGVKFIRHISRNLESAYWPDANINNLEDAVSDAGLLHGLEGISQGVGLDINPWVIGGHNSRIDGGSFLGDTGVDVFYQITPGMRGVLTVNTDFAETEADARQINLTRFSLHFPEKRDFFLDGANFFNFGIAGEDRNRYSQRLIPFFSRRLGLDSAGEPLPVIAGGRFTGQAGDWNIGLLNILQERQYDNSNFAAMRVSRNLGRHSSAGMIATLGNASAEGSNALYGIDTRLATSTLGGDKNMAFTAYGLQSVTEKPGLGRSVDNAFGADLNYPNDLFFGRAGFLQIGDDFTAGTGFVPRKGIREFYFKAGAGPRPGKYGILQVTSEVELDHISGLDGMLQTREFEMTPLEIRFISGEELKTEVMFAHESLMEDFNLLGEILIPADKYGFVTRALQVNSAKHRNLWATFGYEWGGFYNGERYTYEVTAGWQVFVNLFLGAEIERSHISFPGRDMEVGIYRGMLNVLFNPRINLFTFVQYDNVTQIAGWQSRFHWIIKPGREVLVAWNSNINDPMDRFAISESSLRFKLKYNVRF